jgi:carbonic anhydrase
MNCLSVLQFAVEVLQVEHVIVCGHYGCGGIKAAMEDQAHGVMDDWLRHIKDVSRFNAEKLERLAYEEEFKLLCELNVREQVTNVCNTTIMKHAWQKGAEIAVHGWVYDIESGILKDLNTSVASSGQ